MTSGSDNSSRPKGRRPSRLRFGLQGLFLFVLLIGMGLWCWNLISVQWAIYSLENSGWRIEKNGNVWKLEQVNRRHRIPSHLVARLTQIGSVDYSGIDSCSPEDIAVLGNLPRLHYLSLSSCRLSDPHFEALANLKGLTDLDLSGAELDAQRLEYVARLPHLRRLVLRAARIEPDALAALSRCENLEILDLSEMLLRQRDQLSHLRFLPKLQHLDMRGMFHLGEEVFPHLTQVQSLKSCDLRYSELIDWPAYRRFVQLRPDVKVLIDEGGGCIR